MDIGQWNYSSDSNQLKKKTIETFLLLDDGHYKLFNL